MIDFLFQMGVSNACLSLALAIVAMVVGAKAKRPHLAHMLWLLVFIKLLTPPIVTIPIITIPAQGETAVAINENSRPGPLLSDSRELNIEASLWSKVGSAAWNHARVWLPPIWLLGSAVVFAFSIVRVCRFSRLLAAESDIAPQEMQTAAVETARRLALNKIPTILTTSANLSPMVWWTGGKVRIVIPTALLEKMDAHEWQWVLAHELAHVRRRDYLVRWLEWLACVLFWWNPVVWWAQRNLRAMEEICCDDLVISCLNPKPKFYVDSLLSAVEFLARPVLRPPSMASEINSGGFLERRFKMILSEKTNRSNSRCLQICVLLCVMVVLPLGIASAQDYKAVEQRLGEAVSKGELSLEQAGKLTEAEARAKKAPIKKAADSDGKDSWWQAFKKKIEAAVKAGVLTEEEAKAKLAKAKLAPIKKAPDSDGKDIDPKLEAFKKKIEAAVKAGVLTEEEAKAKLDATAKKVHAKKPAAKHKKDIDPNLEAFKKKLEAAVEAGVLTEEEAKAKLDATAKKVHAKKPAAKDKKDVDPKLEAFKKKIEAAVEAGVLTEEEAKAKLAPIKKAPDAKKAPIKKAPDAKKAPIKKAPGTEGRND